MDDDSLKKYWCIFQAMDRELPSASPARKVVDSIFMACGCGGLKAEIRRIERHFQEKGLSLKPYQCNLLPPEQKIQKFPSGE